MLATIGHPTLQQTMYEAFCQQRHHRRIVAKCTIADDVADAMVEVQHRGKGQVHAAGPQLGAEYITAGRGRSQRLHCTGLGVAGDGVQPHISQDSHGRQVRESVGAKSLHAAPLVVHHDQQISAKRLYFGAQIRKLRALTPVAAEQYQPANQGMAQSRPVTGAQGQTGYINDQRGMRSVEIVVKGHWRSG